MNEIEEWLKNNEEIIKYYILIKEEPEINEIKKSKKIEIPEIDLHGLTLPKAISTLKSFIIQNIGRYEKIRVIHGKGKHSISPVLREGVRDWLKKYAEMQKLIKDFSYEKPENGGTGATIVWLLK